MKKKLVCLLLALAMLLAQVDSSIGGKTGVDFDDRAACRGRENLNGTDTRCGRNNRRSC